MFKRLWNHLFVVLFILFAVDTVAIASEPITLKMVYKETGNPPYMDPAPDNSGLYFDMMSRAVQKIGCQLKTIRLPKKRTYRLLEYGEADLYASGAFRKDRSKFLYYFPNGLERFLPFYGLTSINIAEIETLKEIKKHGLIWAVELGSSHPNLAQKLGIEYTEVIDISVPMAIQFISAGRPFFIRVVQQEFLDYCKEIKTSSPESLGIRVHMNCCEPQIEKLYTCFSRFSPYYKEIPNPSFDKNKPVHADNFPFQLKPGTIAHQLQNALREMVVSGEIKKLKQKYKIKM